MLGQIAHNKSINFEPSAPEALIVRQLLRRETPSHEPPGRGVNLI